jgi:hypothetical protein
MPPSNVTTTMGNTYSPRDERWTSEQDGPSTGVASVQVHPGEQYLEEPVTPCEKCGAPIKFRVMPVCRKCGWYARLGTYIEVDPSWDAQPEEDAKRTANTILSQLRVWLTLLPRWAWIIIASVAVVIVESVAARLITASNSHLRMIWSLTQLATGALVFAGFYVFNFLTVAADDADMGVLDLILRPFKTWMCTLRGLPARLWVVDSAACGLTAAVMSIVVIGGIPYHVLWDWGFKEPPKQNLIGAVMSRMQKSEDKGADNLEDAVGDFAASQDLDSKKPEPKPVPQKQRERADCVILGYLDDGKGRIATLVLATSHRGKLVYAGQVAPQVTDDEMAELARKLSSVKTTRPFLAIRTTAIWVTPKFTCRVTFKKRSESGGLTDIQWDRLLGELRGM